MSFLADVKYHPCTRSIPDCYNYISLVFYVIIYDSDFYVL